MPTLHKKQDPISVRARSARRDLEKREGENAREWLREAKRREVERAEAKLQEMQRRAFEGKGKV
jgi:hypothetical protein